ncbi:Uncharacterised protein [Escherichia coli]|nr:Uncharacterised protein [Escherichia coli]CAD5883118.1 Uncharacterised protein [Escherichia coli]
MINVQPDNRHFRVRQVMDFLNGQSLQHLHFLPGQSQRFTTTQVATLEVHHQLHQQTVGCLR